MENSKDVLKRDKSHEPQKEKHTDLMDSALELWSGFPAHFLKNYERESSSIEGRKRKDIEER